TLRVFALTKSQRWRTAQIMKWSSFEATITNSSAGLKNGRFERLFTRPCLRDLGQKESTSVHARTAGFISDRAPRRLPNKHPSRCSLMQLENSFQRLEKMISNGLMPVLGRNAWPGTDTLTSQS